MSLRHVVCFRFLEGTTPEQVSAMAEGLRRLPARIPELAAYHVGPDLGINDDTWDFAVVADFADEADYRTYVADEQHQEAIATLIRPITAERVAVQYEF